MTLSILAGLQGATSLQPPPSYAAFYLCFHFIFAYTLTSSRLWKLYYRLDHQISPRQDLDKYGARAVSSGKISQKTLDQIRRVEGAHANSMEHFAFFAAAIIWAHVAGVETGVVNARALAYTIYRISYYLAYVMVTDLRVSYLRGVAWWASSIVCMRLIWSGGNSIDRSPVPF